MGYMKLVAIAAVVASVVLLTGCATQLPVPGEASAYQVLAAQQLQLRATWDLTGLGGKFEQPEYRVVARDPDVWEQAVAACMAGSGVTLRHARSDGDGYRAVLPRGDKLTNVTQRLWYRCFAQNQPEPLIASDSQLEYLWNYYHRWVIPCVRLEGYALNRLPSKKQFLATKSFQWSPYGATTAILTDDQYLTLVAQCGPERGIIGA